MSARFDRILRRVRAASGPQAIIRQSNGSFEMIPAASLRLDALLSSPTWSARVVSVFSPDVSADVLRAEGVL